MTCIQFILCSNASIMKVFIYEHYDYAIHGNQRYLMLLLDRTKHLYGEDFDVTLFVPSNGVFYHASKDLGRVFALNKSSNIFRCFLLWKKLRRLRPDAIICNNEASFLMVLPAAVSLHLKMIWQVKNLHRSNWSDALCFYFSDRVLAIARKVIEVKNPHLVRRFRGKVFIQPIGANLEDFLALPVRPSEQSELHLLALIFISRDKGVDILVEALEELDLKRIRAHVKIAGITPSGCEQLEETLRTRTARLRHIKVEWMGWRDDVLALMQWCDVLVHPSRTDGVPRSIVEAMASGRAIIATNVGGIPESLTDGREGFVVSSGDSEALADRIERLAGDPDLRIEMGLAGRARARTEFNIDCHIARLKKHLEAITTSE